VSLVLNYVVIEKDLVGFNFGFASQPRMKIHLFTKKLFDINVGQSHIK